MLMDSRLEFAVAQALTATGASTNVIDFSRDRNVGRGRDLYLVYQVDVAADGTTGDETYSVDLETDDNAAHSSAETLLTFTIARGAAAGTRVVHRIPNDNQRYMRLNSTLAGTTPTITYSAWLTDQPVESWEALPDAAN